MNLSKNLYIILICLCFFGCSEEEEIIGCCVMWNNEGLFSDEDLCIEGTFIKDEGEQFCADVHGDDYDHTEFWDMSCESIDIISADIDCFESEY